MRFKQKIKTEKIHYLFFHDVDLMEKNIEYFLAYRSEKVLFMPYDGRASNTWITQVPQG